MRLLLVLALVVTACAEAGSDSPAASTATIDTASTSATSSTAADTTSTAPSTSDGTATTRPAPDPDRPLAPDFSLTLSDGTEYQLANEVRPVYLVFWAEW